MRLRCRLVTVVHPSPFAAAARRALSSANPEAAGVGIQLPLPMGTAGLMNQGEERC